MTEHRFMCGLYPQFKVCLLVKSKIQTSTVSAVHSSTAPSLCSHSTEAEFRSVDSIIAPISNLTRLHTGFLSPRQLLILSQSDSALPSQYGSVPASDRTNYSLMTCFY